MPRASYHSSYSNILQPLPSLVRADGTNVTLQHEWLSLAIADGTTTDAFFKFGIPSLLKMPHTGVLARGPKMNGTTDLEPGWEAVLTTFAQQAVLPRMKNKTAIGVFLGDEVCCHNSTCWHGQLYPISAKLRSLLGQDAILYENDCGDSVAGGCDAARPACEKPLDKFPPALNWVSIDLYDGYLPNDSNGSSEAVKAKHWADTEMYPRMAAHQQLVTVYCFVEPPRKLRRQYLRPN